jgi:nucleoside-diphosphate-sugar epimerase
VDIYLQAVEKGSYQCYLSKDTRLPMMYMPDAIKATLMLMQADAEKISIRSSYNLSGMSFTPSEVADEIRKYLPAFQVSYSPDYRQQIADSWPQSIDDSFAQQHWGWKPEYDLTKMSDDMISHITLMKKQPAGSHI